MPTHTKDEDGTTLMQLSIQTSRDGDRAVLTVSGEIDIASAPDLRQRLLEVIDDGATVVAVDVSDVTFMDSTGLGVLVGGLKRVRQHDGNLVVVNPSGPVRKIFDVTGLTDVFGVVDSLDDVPDPA